MNRVQASTHIDAPRHEVWVAVADFGQIANFNPSVSESHLTGEANRGEGATRHCSLTLAGASVEERVVDWQEGASYTVEIYESSRVPMITNAHGTIALAEDGSGTKATMVIEYDTKYGPIGKLMDRMAIRGQNTKAAGLVVAGLKHYVETGETVRQGVRVDTSAVAVA